jgi:hypothetical protein
MASQLGYVRLDLLPRIVPELIEYPHVMTNAILQAEGLGESWLDLLRHAPDLIVTFLEPNKPNKVVRLKNA